jgi:hypothetical protein
MCVLAQRGPVTGRRLATGVRRPAGLLRATPGRRGEETGLAHLAICGGQDGEHGRERASTPGGGATRPQMGLRQDDLDLLSALTTGLPDAVTYPSNAPELPVPVRRASAMGEGGRVATRACF